MEESLPFPVSVGLLPTAPDSGITASKKGMARSAILGGWDREFAACGERKASSGKKRQPPGVCLQASIWKEQVGKIPWRRKWQPTPVFLPGDSHGQRSLVGYIVHGVPKSRTQLSNLTSKPEISRYYRNY